MATTLNVVTTDCAVSAEMLKKALSENVKITYNCLSVDGDQSTNDTLAVMANGLAGNDEITEDGNDFEIFKKALYIVMMNITRMLAKDGEGATKLIECTVSSAPDFKTAKIVGKSVIMSNLFKAAIFGEDANVGRILCAVGYSAADVDINKIDVDMASEGGRISVCRQGACLDFSEELAAKILHCDEIQVLISLNAGDSEATAWGCDLTYEYVKINGDYRS
jgi:glutamate N-acetyltransferase/amino-acid N-acetyltransferase